ncbi:MAG: GNAT family N-acetyltransferase [Caulobacteraceae bacterium]|nr:GNAT family N-acetyltransferase [Caulobacteraceae bacterium]
MRLRRAGLEDMPALAVLHRLTVRACLPFLPELHTAQEDLAYFCDQLFPSNTVWLVETDGMILGYAAATPGWLNHLYVHSDHHGRGVGERLLRQVMDGQDGLQLWAFQKNAAARRFYERHAFRLQALTDGARNEEQEPDALYAWTRVSDG